MEKEKNEKTEKKEKTKQKLICWMIWIRFILYTPYLPLFNHITINLIIYIRPSVAVMFGRLANIRKALKN